MKSSGIRRPDEILTFQRGAVLSAAEANGNTASTKLSVVLPCFNEEDNVRPMMEALAELDQGLSCRIETIFVDDGSSDSTWARIREASAEFQNVRGVRFSRNFGHQAALLAGLGYATGDAVVTMDADLQHPPSLLPAMLDSWRKGAEVVTTTRRDDKKLPLVKRVTSALFYRLFRLLTGLPITAGQADFRLLDRKVVRALLDFKENGLFLRGLVCWMGFKHDDLVYSAGQRHAGRTKYSARRMVLLALDSAFSFSNIPLRIGLIVGLGMTGLCFTYGLYALVVRVFFHKYFVNLVSGWASLAVLISFMFGLLFIQIGLLGEYLARVYMECKGRPRYIVSEDV